MKRVRWACPEDLHPAVLGPSKPRRDNLCRYCVPCSVKVGKLIDRTAPAIESKREARATAVAAKATARRERLKKHQAERWVIGDVDMRREITRLKKLVAKRYEMPRTMEGLRVTWERRSDGCTSGRAWGGSRIHISAGTDPHEVRETILHELMHVVGYRRGWRDDRCSSHSMQFRNELTDTACIAFGLKLAEIAAQDHGSSSRRYEIDWAITRAMRARATQKLPEAACPSAQ